jgi:hypothetical protein
MVSKDVAERPRPSELKLYRGSRKGADEGRSALGSTDWNRRQDTGALRAGGSLPTRERALELPRPLAVRLASPAPKEREGARRVPF